jgi:hypothetical protein
MTQELSFDCSYVKLELFDIERIQWLLRNTEISKNDKFLLQKYYKRKTDFNKVQVVYQLGIKSKTFEESGRLVVGKGGVGLQSFSRDIRNFLAEKHYWDIDIVNAQPNILWQYAEKQGWKCNNIKYFCENRDTIISELMNEGLTRDESKQRLIQLFFGSDYIDGLSDFIRNFLHPELKLMRSNMTRIFPKLYAKLSKRPNPSASLMAHILQTEERMCMLKINEACTLKQREFDVFMHDGGYIRKNIGEDCIQPDFLEYCMDYVKNSTGYDLIIIQKPIISSIVMKDDEVLHDSVLINDLYAAEQFVKLMGDDLVFDNGILYVYHQGIWSENEELLNTCISDLKEKLVFKQMGGISGIKTYDYSGSVKNRENLKKMLPSVLEKKENFLESGRTKSTGKLLFKNGIYDFKTSTLTDFDRSIVFSSMIPFDWNPEVQEEDIEFVTQVFFKDAFKNEEVPALLKHFLMRGMIGDYQMKKFLTCIGPTNCSKGMLQEFMKYIFSGNVGNFNCNSLIARKNTEGTRDLGWFMGLVNTRICFGSEIKSDKDSKIDSEMIKQIVSGGETTTGRRLFKDEQNFISRTMPILLVNEMSTFSSMNDAIKNRLIPIEYDYSFVEFPTKAYQKQSDPQLKNKLKDEKYANAMIHILNREYQKWMTNEYKELPLPESALDFKDDIIPIVDIEEELEDVFEITKNFDDFVEIKEIERELINKGSKIYKNVISTQLQRIGCKANKKYIEKRQVRVILGIKRK